MMTKQLYEKISQYLDGDLEREEALHLLQKMQLDPHMQAKWQRYLIAQQALRSQTAVIAESDFLNKVKHALEHEPTYLLPKRQPAKTTARKTALLAVAASVAALAVIIPVWTNSPLSVPSAQMQLSQDQTQEFEAPERVRVYPVNQRFQDYLQAHNGSLYTNGSVGFQAKTQLASYGRE